MFAVALLAVPGLIPSAKAEVTVDVFYESLEPHGEWIEAADYYAKIHVAGKSHLLRETMNELEARLDPDVFFRVHRSAIVNLEKVKEIQPYTRGEHVVIMNSGAKVRLSRGRRDKLEELLGQSI